MLRLIVCCRLLPAQVDLELTLTWWACAQAYGAGNFMALGIVLQQALIISTLVFLAILALWSQAGPILLFAGMYPLHTPQKSLCDVHT